MLPAVQYERYSKSRPLCHHRYFLGYFVMLSGVHATLADVLGVFTVPAIPRYDPTLFSARVKKLIERFDSSHKPGESILTNSKLSSALDSAAVIDRGSSCVYSLPTLLVPVLCLDRLNGKSVSNPYRYAILTLPPQR